MAPAELEAVLVHHPKITDAAVTSVQDERKGEAPKAFVVRKDDRLTEEEIMEYMASKVGQRQRERGRGIGGGGGGRERERDRAGRGRSEGEGTERRKWERLYKLSMM